MLEPEDQKESSDQTQSQSSNEPPASKESQDDNIFRNSEFEEITKGA